MTTRCKFVCNSVMHRIWKGKISSVEVELNPVYSNDPKSENKAFWDSTPGGSLKLSLSKPEHVDLFENQKEYYIDISDVEPQDANVAA